MINRYAAGTSLHRKQKAKPLNLYLTLSDLRSCLFKASVHNGTMPLLKHKMQHEITVISEDNNLEYKRGNKNITDSNPLYYAFFSVYRRGAHYLSPRYPFLRICGAIYCHGNKPEVPSLSRITSMDATPHTRKKNPLVSPHMRDKLLRNNTRNFPHSQGPRPRGTNFQPGNTFTHPPALDKAL
jgi:hypothetical protein